MLSGPNETGILLPPPLIVLAALVAAWGLESFAPTSIGLPTAVGRPLGGLVILATVAFVVWLFLDFRRAGRDYDYRKAPTGLVTDGPFAFSRNPGYVAMIVSCFGFGLFFNSLWAFVAALPAAIALDLLVVRREEDLLRERFGDIYARYESRVRRWF